jgi:hypothetical protein
MFIWPIFFILASFADDISIEEFCFSSPQRLQAAIQKSKVIFVPSDETSTNGHCLTVKARSHRRELIQNYIRNVDPDVKISFSSAEIKRPPCRLKIEKMRSLKKNETDLIVQNGILASKSISEGSANHTSQITTLNDFELSHNQDVVKGNCRYITPKKYEINLEVSKISRPLIMGVPEGSTVVLNNPPRPPDQETSRLTTSLQLTRGERIEIGSVLKDLRSKGTTVDLPTDATYRDTDSEHSERVFLSID